jgi:hypothetical protein
MIVMTQHSKTNNIGLALLAEVSQELGSLEMAVADLRARVKAAMAAFLPTSEIPCDTEALICDGHGLSAAEEEATQEEARDVSEGAPTPCATEPQIQFPQSEFNDEAVDGTIPMAVVALPLTMSIDSYDPEDEQTCAQVEPEDRTHEAASSEDIKLKTAGDDPNSEAIVAFVVETLPSTDDETPSLVHGEELTDGAKHSETGTATIGHELSDILSTEHDEAAREPAGQGMCLDPQAFGYINAPIAEAGAETVLDRGQVGDDAVELSSELNDPVAPVFDIDPGHTIATSRVNNPASPCGTESPSISHSGQEIEAAVEAEQARRPVRSNRWFAATSIALVLVAAVTVYSRDVWIAAL